MNANESPDRDARLQARLIAEAVADQPEFSERLHDRIMQAVRESPRPAARRRARRVAARRGATGLAAAVAVALAVWLMRGVDDDSAAERPAPLPRGGPVENSTEPSLGPEEDHPASLAMMTPPAADRLTALVDATFAGPQWAYLDHDARLAAGMVLQHIPFEFPVAEGP